MRIIRCGETVWERARPAEPPTVSRVRAKLGTDGELQVSWSSTCQTDDEAAWIRWSRDGEQWYALTIVRGQRRASVPAEQLPSGPISLQVMVHDGFSTVVATSGTIELPTRPPVAAILHPREGHDVYDERHLHLWGTAGDVLGSTPPDEAFDWEVDGREAGRGPDIWVESPGAGAHTVRLVVSTEEGLAVAEQEFYVQDGGQTELPGTPA